jgi:hypothetical protein
MAVMKKFISLFAICLCLPAAASVTTPVHPSDVPLDEKPAPEYIEKSAAVVRIMNKAAGRAATATVPVGRAAEYEKLEIIVRSCKETPPFERKDYFMFVEINKKAGDNARLFSGWMTANEPGVNPLQDADYDLWLVRCE